MRSTLFVLSSLALGLSVAACGKDGGDKDPTAAAPAAKEGTPDKAAKADAPPPAPAARAPATVDAAKTMLSKFLAPGADRVALSKALKPADADYAAVFTDAEMAKKAQAQYAGLWGMVDKQPLGPKDGQTELLVWKATTDELKAGTGDSGEFPGGYKKAAAHLKPGLTVFRWKFVKPGETSGMAFDGLYNLDGRWALMPKPWRVTDAG